MRTVLVAVASMAAFASVPRAAAEPGEGPGGRPPGDGQKARHGAATKADGPAASAWCAPEFEAIAGDACFLDGTTAKARSTARTGGDAGRRTLVIFLHGAIAKNTTWQHNHQRQLFRLAKGIGFDAIFPRSPLTEGGYVWPGSVAAQEKVEEELIEGWMTGKRALEQRAGRAYDEVFVMGFSSGAYFVSSLAMRGRLDVDGYAAFAGGMPLPPRPAPVTRWAPSFVGVCGDDPTSASHSHAFAGSLATAGIPRMTDVQPVGHGLSHLHVHHALAFFRRHPR